CARGQVNGEGFEGALIFSTSGSTGAPKCVISSKHNRAFSTQAIASYLGLQRGQRIINALAPSFDYGFYQGLLSEHCGLDMDLIPSAQMTGEVLERTRRTARAVLPLTPALAARLCRASGPGETISNVEVVTLTGGSVPMPLRRKLAAL